MRPDGRPDRTGLRVPHDDRPAVEAGCDEASVRAQSACHDAPDVGPEAPELTSRRDIPRAERVVLARREEPGTVAADVNGHDGTVVAGEASSHRGGLQGLSQGAIRVRVLDEADRPASEEQAELGVVVELAVG